MGYLKRGPDNPPIICKQNKKTGRENMGVTSCVGPGDIICTYCHVIPNGYFSE